MTPANPPKDPATPRVAPNQSVMRAVAIMRCFIDGGPDLSLSELSRRTDIHISTVYRIAQSLVAGGMLTRDPVDDRYAPGVALLAFAGATFSAAGFPVARQIMDGLAERTGESVALGVLDDDCVVVLLTADSPNQLRFTHRSGARLPLHVTALGKVLLAFSATDSDEVIGRLGRLRRFTEGSIGRIGDLRTAVADTHGAGYAVADEEMLAGVRAIAVPVTGADGSTNVALALTGPRVRLTEERDDALVDDLQAAATALARIPTLDRITAIDIPV